MKKEEKDLLMRDLSARLPYGVKFECSKDVYIAKGLDLIVTDEGDWESAVTAKGIEPIEINFIEPYLRPLVSMTEEEKKELSARWLWTRCFDNINLAYLCDSAKDYVACSSGEYFELQDWLNAHHFDYRGLIPKGLALEAPKDMYNEIEEEKK